MPEEMALNRLEYLRTLPSYLTGSVRQTLATLDKPEDFGLLVPRPVVLVPGAFCTSSVMNRLGRALQERGRSVAVAPSFPYYFSAFANLCRIDQAVGQFLNWLDGLADQGIEEVDVAAHSNGGLICLLAQERLERGAAQSRVRMGQLVTMATPFGGFPGARALSLMIPCCRDLVDGAEALDLAARAGGLVVRSLVSAADSLIPPDRQFLNPDQRTVMEGFQHMDFIVGSDDRVARSAEEVVRWLGTGC